MPKKSKQQRKLQQEAIARARTQPRNNTVAPGISPPTQYFKLAQYQGPIPPPELLFQYDQLIDNGAERIFAQFEAQSEHRRNLERTVVNSDQRRANWGLVCGTLVSLAAIAVAGLAVYTGHTLLGLSAAFGTIATLAAVFVHGTQSRKKERLARAQMQTPTAPGSSTTRIDHRR